MPVLLCNLLPVSEPELKPYFEREAWKISCFYPMVRRMLFCWLSIPGFLVVVRISWDFLKNDYLKNQDQIWTFNHPKLNTKKHDHLKHETRDKYQSWKAKLDRPQIQGIKWKNWGSIRSPSPTPPTLERNQKRFPVHRSPEDSFLTLACSSYLWYKHFLINIIV